MHATIRRIATTALDFLLPPHCPGCDTQIHAQGTFCRACFTALTFITEPLCHSCGLPFASLAQAGPGHTCLTCRTHPAPLARSPRRPGVRRGSAQADPAA